VSNTLISLSVPTSLNAGSVAELATLARAQPGKLNWAGVTGALDFLFAGFLKSAGLDMTKVPYRNPVDALTDLSEGRIDVLMAALGIVLPRTQDGKVKVLAIVNPQRSPLLPHVPTAAEVGFSVLTYEPIGGLFAPREMPAAVRERIAADLQAVAADPAIAARVEPNGGIVSFMPAADFAAALERERNNLAAVVEMLGVKPTQ
jgi:tripartite-type tricarboxylate transporter receptor subunit TctC